METWGEFKEVPPRRDNLEPSMMNGFDFYVILNSFQDLVANQK